jgi:TolA-binding protein
MGPPNEHGLNAMIFSNPAGKTEFREPENARAEPRPPARWGFDERKLRRLLEAAHRVHLARTDLAERYREARSTVAELRGIIARNQADRGAPGRLVHAEDELRRLTGEQQALIADTSSIIAIAGACESWARGQGWDPTGRPGAPVLPRVGDATPDRSPLLDHWGA